MRNQLAKLYFGKDAAEMDIAEGGLLQAGFLRTSVYEAARTARKHLIIGRMGSGKSAICRTLAAENDPAIKMVLVTPDRLSADEIRGFELPGIPLEMAKGLIWRYVLTTEVAKHAVAHAKAAHRKRRPASVEALERFLVANGELDNQRRTFSQIIQKLKGSVSLEAFGVKAAAEFSGPTEGHRTANQVDVIDRQVSRALHDLACPADHPRLLILIDQLEDVWSNDAESDNLIIGLLRATRDITPRFPRVSCVVFLRSDIYDTSQFPGKDKFRSEERQVDWTGPQLLDLILTRARASLGKPITADHLWRRLFPPKVGKTPTTEFILSHTLMRPREIIQLCNRCKDTAEQNGHDVIRESDIRESITKYSSWKLQDLASEYRVNYPFLDGLYGMFKYSGYMFGRDGFKRRLATSLDVLRNRYPEMAHMLTEDVLLGLLYDIGFLGIHRNGSVIYRHRNDDRVEPTDDTFSIHPCFRYALHAVQPTMVVPFEPERVRRDVIYGFEGQHDSPVWSVAARGSTEHRLLDSTTHQARQLLASLHEANLPADIHDEVATNIDQIIRSTDDLTGLYPDTSIGAAVGQAMKAATFFLQLSKKLEEDGLGASDNALAFISRASDAGQRLRRQAAGVERS